MFIKLLKVLERRSYFAASLCRRPKWVVLHKPPAREGGRSSSREERPKSQEADDRGQHRHHDAQWPPTQARGFTTPEPAEREPVRQTSEHRPADPQEDQRRAHAN